MLSFVFVSLQKNLKNVWLICFYDFQQDCHATQLAFMLFKFRY